MKDRVILTDVDGCLLYWNKAFSGYMQSMGYETIPGFEKHYSLAIRYNFPEEDMAKVMAEFNESEHMQKLEPFRDAVENVTKLKEQGFTFIAITSMSEHPDAYEYREENLSEVFGVNAISELICLPMGSSKQETLERWKGSGYFWIEDNFNNAMDGTEVGLNSILINATYNAGFVGKNITRVPNEAPWQSIYKMVVEEYSL